MQRRQFLTSAGLSLASGAVAAPAQAQVAPEIKWRLSSSFPSNLDILFGGARTFADAVSELTGGRFVIEVHPPGEIASALDAFDLVEKGDLDCAQTALHYHWGKEAALVFATGIPFGMNAREQNAFFRHGGGTDLINEVLASHHIFALPAGNTGCQMGGWFKNELRSAADLRGLKFRISGIAGKVLQKLGAVPTAVARNDLANAMTTGRLDAAAWVSPADDEQLALTSVAPNYYYPGFWQGAMAVHLIFNLDKWNALPKPYQAAVRMAAELANADVLSRYDALNPPAVRRLVEGGAKLKAFPPDIMEASWQAANEVYREIAAQDANFQRVHDAYIAFRNDQYLWWQVAEYPYDNFLIRQRTKG